MQNKEVTPSSNIQVVQQEEEDFILVVDQEQSATNQSKTEKSRRQTQELKQQDITPPDDAKDPQTNDNNITTTHEQQLKTPQQPQNSNQHSQVIQQTNSSGSILQFDQILFIEQCQFPTSLEYFIKLLDICPSIFNAMTTKITGKLAIHLLIFNSNSQYLSEVIQRDNCCGQWCNFMQMSPLHLTIKLSLIPRQKQGAVNCFHLLLQTGKCLVNEMDRLGRTPLHWAAISGVEQVVAKLIKYGAQHSNHDFDDNLPVHYAIDYNHPLVLQYLLQEIGSELLIISQQHESLVDRCIKQSSWDCLTTLLEQGGIQLLSIPNHKQQSPAQVSHLLNNFHHFKTTITDFINLKKLEDITPQIKSQILQVTTTQTPQPIQKSLPTLVVSSDECQFHEPSQQRSGGYPQNQGRLFSLFNPTQTGILQISQFLDKQERRYMFNFKPSLIKQCQLLRVHDYNYIHKLKSIIDFLTNEKTKQDIFHLDSDTYMTEFTLHTASLAAGAVIDGIDQVMDKKVKNAFTVMRPPGHHCGVFGAVESQTQPEGKSNGFCFYNSVAIGAAYLKCVYRNAIKKVAIVDFDVHHGNGTQDIVQSLKPNVRKSLIQLPFASGQMNVNVYKPWLDKQDPKNVLFISSHGYDEHHHNFYPMSGGFNSNDQVTPLNDEDVKDFLDHHDDDNDDDTDYPGGILNLPYGKSTSSPTFRQLYIRYAFPRLLKFKPDFILISAGFDAHQCDDVNDHFGKINEFDYSWITKCLVEIANTTCEGRIVSVLEGGYKTKGGMISPFAQSVACHLRELGRDNFSHYMSMNSEEMKQQNEICQKKYLRKRQAKANKRYNLRFSHHHKKKKCDQENGGEGSYNLVNLLQEGNSLQRNNHNNNNNNDLVEEVQVVQEVEVVEGQQENGKDVQKGK